MVAVVMLVPLEPIKGTIVALVCLNNLVSPY